MVFSLILLAPSWGGMINGIMTLSGAWHKLRTDPILKFLIVSLSFYGMSTFEGPMMAIKTVNALSHYTDWTVGHVHSGALGWVGLISMGTMYYLIPRVFGRTEMASVPLINLHFWVATVGIVLYIAAMWIAGVMQGLMWRAVGADGTLTYTFVESVKATYPFYAIRLLGGLLYLSGMLIMAWNTFLTIAAGRSVEAPIPAPMPRNPTMKISHDAIERRQRPAHPPRDPGGERGRPCGDRPALLSALDTSRGGAQALSAAAAGGRDIYVREGCYNCHFADDPAVPRRDRALRPYSVAGEFVYDRRSSGAASARGRTSRAWAAANGDDWHRVHLANPRDVVPESNMPG
jgi:hypothetical protein